MIFRTATALALAAVVLAAPASAPAGPADVLPPPRPPEAPSSPAPVAPPGPAAPAPTVSEPASVPAVPIPGSPPNPPGQAAVPVSGPACGTRAARYATDKGFALWVTRRGTMQQENPLRPLSPAEFVILQVVVNGRLATAYGPDYDRLQQGFSVHDLEKDGAARIAWAEQGDGLPPAIQVVAEDGRALFGPMRFVTCGDAPIVKATASPRPLPGAEPKPKGRKPAGGPAEGSEKPPSRLPQGALPGVAIPKGAID